MIIRHPSHPCQDPDSISQTSLFSFFSIMIPVNEIQGFKEMKKNKIPCVLKSVSERLWDEKCVLQNSYASLVKLEAMLHDYNNKNMKNCCAIKKKSRDIYKDMKKYKFEHSRRWQRRSSGVVH